MGSTEGSKYGEYTYAELEREPYLPSEKLRISITGAGGFVESHIARRLKSEWHYIIASDWKKNEPKSEVLICNFCKAGGADLSQSLKRDEMDRCKGEVETGNKGNMEVAIAVRIEEELCA